MKKKSFVSAVYDRRKSVEKTGVGSVEIFIYLSRTERKYIALQSCNPEEWYHIQRSQKLKDEIAIYQDVVDNMIESGEDLCINTFNKFLGLKNKKRGKKEAKSYNTPNGFIEFMLDQMDNEEFAPGTRKHKKVAIDAVRRFGRLNNFKQLIPENVKAFDDFLHKETERTLTTINNYHKILRKYTQLAFLLGFIRTDPYKHPLCKFSRGISKERRPLTEDELIRLRKLNDLPKKLERARDLFIFCAYTGLSYSDSQIFDFNTMTEKQGDLYFIDGKRIKTGNKFFTPILPPAMEILKKYGYEVPKLSNQKANDYLHDIEARMKLNKPMTVHVARHSFATLLLANDVPMENVGRMLGHTNIKTTQIYAHILKTTIERHAVAVASKIR